MKRVWESKGKMNKMVIEKAEGQNGGRKTVREGMGDGIGFSLKGKDVEETS